MAVITEALCTLQNLKDYLGVTSSTYDTQLEFAINHATRMILDYIDRNILSASYTEYLDGHGKTFIQLANYPLTATPTQVNVDGNREFAAANDYVIDTNFMEDRANGILYSVTSPGYDTSVWPVGRQNIKVVYTAGYATVPDSLKYTCIEFAAFLFKNKAARGNQQVSMGGVFEIAAKDAIPVQFRQQLDPWQRVHEQFSFLDPFDD